MNNPYYEKAEEELTKEHEEAFVKFLKGRKKVWIKAEIELDEAKNMTLGEFIKKYYANK